MIIFTHIPRTCGNSLQEKFLKTKMKICKRFHWKIQLLIDGKSKVTSKKDIVIGHFAYGVHVFFETDNYDYITVLRNPIQRWISLFNYTMKPKKRKSNPIVGMWYKKKNDIRRFLDYCIESNINHNIMVRQLSGIEKTEQIEPTQMHSMYVWANRKTTNTENEMKLFLEESKNNLMKYKLFGVSEKIDVFWNQFKTIFKVGSGKLRRVKKSLPLFNIDWKDSSVVRRLKVLNAYDIELYNFARKML
jgi:hypothetical protein